MLKRFVCTLLLVAAGLLPAGAFSMLGPTAGADWMDGRKNYGQFGPMNIGEEYRWNVPTLYYAFDNTFLHYFGQTGVDEIEKAIKILNDFPNASDVDPDTYPLDTRRLNARAQALNLFDLKTTVLGVMVTQMGVADSINYVYALRDVTDTPVACTDFWVMRRNFDFSNWRLDPMQLKITSYINGQLWTYRDIFCSQTTAFTINEPVDPVTWNQPVGSMFPTGNSALLRYGVGQFHTGLTRDDAACLKYLYQREHMKFETNVILATRGGGAWGSPTNAGSNLVNGVRYGVNRVQFKRLNFDSLIGEVFQPITNTYSEQVITNGVEKTQYVRRVISLPDVVFMAADLASWTTETYTFALNSAGMGSIQLQYSGSASPPSLISGFFAFAQTGSIVGADAPGPGIWQPLRVFVLDNAGPINYNPNGFFVGETDAIPTYRWGSFGAGTNVIVYPDGAAVGELEAQIFDSANGGSAWGPPGYVPTDQAVQPGDTTTGG